LSTLELLLIGGIYFNIFFTVHSRDQREGLTKKKELISTRSVAYSFYVHGI